MAGYDRDPKLNVVEQYLFVIVFGSIYVAMEIYTFFGEFRKYFNKT